MRTIVKRHKASGHEETNVIVDFGQLTHEEIKTLAEFYVQHRLEEELKRYDHKLPEQITVLAADYVHPYIHVAKPINLPRQKLEKVVSKARETLEAALEGLSKEEIAALFNENRS